MHRSLARLAPLALLALAACGDAIAPAAPTRPLVATATTPRLLSCPSDAPTESARGLIGVLGGLLSTSAARLDVPAGAVVSLTEFEVAVPPSAYMQADLHAVGLSSYVFNHDVQVTLSYARCATDGLPTDARLRAVYFDPATGTVLEDMGGTVDPASRTITFTTGHFSSYAVAY